MDFESRSGISNIISACNKFYHSRDGPLDFGRFIISGNATSVDKLMLEIQQHLDGCQQIHCRNNFW